MLRFILGKKFPNRPGGKETKNFKRQFKFKFIWNCFKFERYLSKVFVCYSIPSTYSYSALTQYDNDRDEEINDLEDHLDILIEDSSSSDNEEEVPSKDILDIDAVSFFAVFVAVALSLKVFFN